MSVAVVSKFSMAATAGRTWSVIVRSLTAFPLLAHPSSDITNRVRLIAMLTGKRLDGHVVKNMQHRYGDTPLTTVKAEPKKGLKEVSGLVSLSLDFGLGT